MGRAGQASRQPCMLTRLNADTLFRRRFENIGPSGQALWREVSNKAGSVDFKRGGVSARKSRELVALAWLMIVSFPSTEKPNGVDEEHF